MMEYLAGEPGTLSREPGTTVSYTNLDFLRSSSWDPCGIPAIVREPFDLEVSDIAQLPSDLRAVDLAQYALYLGDRSINPLNLAALELEKISTAPGEHTPKDQSIIDGFLRSSALNDELAQTRDALSENPEMIDAIAGYTTDFTQDNTACLRALQKIADIPDNFRYQRLAREDITAAEMVLRGFIATWVYNRPLTSLVAVAEGIE